ncbi:MULTISPECIES: DivIVA domain-containing protein [unclassified Arthrobacter]|uniref:DivIVA domain-containing protein n=1 Tax=unclassified Arthrobacter TaxID=235627 RepID=UPI0014912AEB|nr:MULTISPECIES: DivIVA domain-containing protein [unclassified Arthrobacter]MBE0009858.1 DivIVA domain-containing protein [Arthrobacter sp. AET 35A]NOJ63802.1 DivIVA domain-containing protein [Arthrobacter sp. 147(2020)]
MALTPEDVVNKRFQPTKFREGYDQDEVDDFLDEIVVELRRLNQENDELRRKLADATSSTSQDSAPDTAVPAPVAASSHTEKVKDEPKTPAAKSDETSATAVKTDAGTADNAKTDGAKANDTKADDTKAVAAKSDDSTTAAAAPAAATPAAGTADAAAGVLAMAQKLHDEYVNAGVEQRDKIIAEAQVKATGMVDDAEEKTRQTLGALEQQKAVLEGKVEQLRTFERDYRSRLKAYIEGQLRDLDSRGSVASEATTS